MSALSDGGKTDRGKTNRRKFQEIDGSDVRIGTGRHAAEAGEERKEVEETTCGVGGGKSGLESRGFYPIRWKQYGRKDGEGQQS